MISLADNSTLDIRYKYIWKKSAHHHHRSSTLSSDNELVQLFWFWIVVFFSWRIDRFRFHVNETDRDVITPWSKKRSISEIYYYLVLYYVKIWSIVMIHDFSLVWSRISDYYHHHLTNNRFKCVICKRVREELVPFDVNAFQMNWIICNRNEYRGKAANKITATIVPIADIIIWWLSNLQS